MASPWDFSTPIWYERYSCADYPTFVPCSSEYTPVDGTSLCPYLSEGEVRKLVSSVSGLDHLEDQLVFAVTDGSDFSEYTVSSGAITLANPAAVIHVGLPYQAKLKMLPLGGDSQDVNQAKKRKVYNVVLRVFQSLGGKFGKDEDSTFPLDMPTSADPLYTGDIQDVSFESSWENMWEPVLIQDDPLPFMLLAAIIRSEISEDK